VSDRCRRFRTTAQLARLLTDTNVSRLSTHSRHSSIRIRRR